MTDNNPGLLHRTCARKSSAVSLFHTLSDVSIICGRGGIPL